jgi:hypothetical protein
MELKLKEHKWDDRPSLLKVLKKAAANEKEAMKISTSS